MQDFLGKARDPDTPVGVLRRMLKSDFVGYETKAWILANRLDFRLSNATMINLLDNYYKIPEALLSRPEADGEFISWALKEHFPPQTVKYLCRSPKMREEDQLKVAKCADRTLKFYLASNPAVCGEAAEILAWDDEPLVRENLSRNPACPPKILVRLRLEFGIPEE